MKTGQQHDNFLALLEENKKIIYKVSNAYCRNPEDRKDLVQEILIQLWKASGKYDPRFKISTWVYRIAMNVAISHYRQEKRKALDASPLDENILEFIDDRPEPEDESGRIPMLYKFIDGLDELNKALIILYLEENSYKTISEILGISETNVATKINRVKKKLRDDFYKTERIL